MAEAPVVDIVDAIASGAERVREALEKGSAVIRVHALPRTELRIRARRRIIRLDEGKLARLEKALVAGFIKTRGEPVVFEDYAKLVGDYKAAAAYIAFLWRNGLVSFDDAGAAINIYMAANALSQKTYEHKIAKALRAAFRLDLEKLRQAPSDDILCIQRGGRVLCRYIVSNMPRSQAKAEVRAAIEAAGFKPA